MATAQDKVRVLRIVEFVGDRQVVEAQVANSLHGEKTYHNTKLGGYVTIRAATIGTYPEILTAAAERNEKEEHF